MFNVKSFIVEGDFDKLKYNPNGIVIGSGIAKRMNINTNDNITIRCGNLSCRECLFYYAR